MIAVLNAALAATTHVVAAATAAISLETRAYAMLAFIVLILVLAGAAMLVATRSGRSKNAREMADGSDTVHSSDWHQELQASRPERVWGEDE